MNHFKQIYMGNTRKTIDLLQKRVDQLEKIVKSDRLILQDITDPSVSLILSIEEGQYKLVKQITTITTQPIENQ